MRLRHPSGRIVHLTCGVSLAEARSPADAFALLDVAAADLRAGLTENATLAGGLSGTHTLGIALRLPYLLAAALAENGRVRTRLRAELDARGLEVVTLSGGSDNEGGGPPPETSSGPDPQPDPGPDPQPGPGPDPQPGPGPDPQPGSDGPDPGPPSGLLPDWSEPARLQHTLSLARILVDLLPEDEVRGAISTCGLGHREGWDETHERATARHLGRLSGGLADLAWRVGRAVRAGFLLAPGYVLDSPEETVTALARVDKDRLGICLDLAQVVRDWPAPQDGIDRLTDAGLSVITARITDPAAAWQPVLRHLLAADAARTEYIEVEGSGPAADDLTYVMRELTALGLVPENQPCAAP